MKIEKITLAWIRVLKSLLMVSLKVSVDSHGQILNFFVLFQIIPKTLIAKFLILIPLSSCINLVS